eukprot:CAMPEP_0167788162 /NCGR_PEP_ID=MMETSP0111_2-20121227/9869_1 /TAXON_ID=91324 /ORGANISM="Lotharella globosa, Strain CCCM811" /LENGTH=725 /DNA_ID=CAMNT_0007679973 /DNA_START=2071 /DNA_END=4248 /DNA_ORIENTATION=+
MTSRLYKAPGSSRRPMWRARRGVSGRPGASAFRTGTVSRHSTLVARGFFDPGVSQAPPETARPTTELVQTAASPSDQKSPRKTQMKKLEIISMVAADKIAKVTLSEDGSTGEALTRDGRTILLRNVPLSLELFKTMGDHGVDVEIKDASPAGSVKSFLSALVIPLFILGAIAFVRRQLAEIDEVEGDTDAGSIWDASASSGSKFGKSRAKLEINPNTGKTFDDVAGCDEAKEELQEIVEFLQDPDKFKNLGAKIPRGVMMDGPPGTGKTLFAKAVAGEAGVPFISATGSSFVELYVGVGASRVRDIFDTAKKNAPCIIFIDEIDAIGRQRGTGIAGGNDEREQTLNEILSQMDGFEDRQNVIVLAATNRADILDPALLRPGRFDRRVTIGLPDYQGRVAILKIHARRKPLARGLDLEAVARRTPGFSGASLENVMNEAAIYAARGNKTEIDEYDIDAAIDRQIVGIEKKQGSIASVLMQRRDLIAYHEAGHALVGALLDGYDEVQKVTIIPRTNGAGGITFFEPNEVQLESGLYSRSYLEGELCVALGGRMAEEIVYGADEVTTGASNDIQQVTNVAREMVTKYGFSDVVGNVAVSTESGNPFLGRRIATGGNGWSNRKLEEVDTEVDRIVKHAQNVCRSILVENRALLDALAQKLLEVETITGDELQRMVVESGAETVRFQPVSNRGAAAAGEGAQEKGAPSTFSSVSTAHTEKTAHSKSPMVT